MTVPAPLQWMVRRAHNAWNRWIVHTIFGRAFPGMGLSALSWAIRASAIGKFQVWFIDLLFWPGHCQEEYERVMLNQPLFIDYRMFRAFLRVMALLLAAPALLFWWLL